MRGLRFAVLGFALLGIAVPGAARADGRCDLNDLIGFQVLFGKPIDSYVQNGARLKGFEGCEPDRVLVFTDNTGVRCKGVSVKPAIPLPKGYVLANAKGDMKLCVEGTLIDVTTTN